MAGNAAAAALAGALSGLLGVACAGAEGLPAPEVSYAADLTLRTGAPGGGAFEASGRSYYADGRRRRELTLAGRDTVMIERPDLGVRWFWVRGTTRASEQPLGASAGVALRGAPPDPQALWRRDARVERRGREEIAGVVAERYDVTAKGGSGSAWLDARNVPVRYEGSFRDGGDGAPEVEARLDFTGIRVGPQDPALFELPEGVERQRMPEGTHGPGTDRKRLQEKLRRERSGG